MARLSSREIIVEKEKDTLRKDTLKREGKPTVDLQDYAELPASYNSTNLTLMARDPYWIYAYWEIASAAIETLKNKLGSAMDKATYVIRMYDTTYVDFNGTNANRVFDIEIDPNANNWYINLWNDNATYCADLGLRLPEGGFFQLVRSNFVTTPRLKPSNRSEEVWMEVKENRVQPPFVMAHLGGEKKKRQPTSKEYPSTGKESESLRAKKLKRITLSEDDIRAYYSKLSPLLRDIISQRLAQNPPRILHTKSNPHSFSLYAKGPIKGLMQGEVARRLLSGASEELLGGASESLFSGASEQNLGELKQRKFFFEIGTELIVYGRTEPDAQVELGDKNVKLHHDGTFNMRFALPEGKVPLDFVAKSSDGIQRREISTEVERTKTRYNP